MSTKVQTINATEEKAEEKKTEEKAEEKKPVIFPRNCINLVEFHNVRWRLNCPRGATLEQLSQSQTYSIFADKLSAFDLIEAVCGKHWVEILVVDAEKGYPITVKVLRTAELPTIIKSGHGTELPEGYEIRYYPEKSTYQAIRLKDEHPMTAERPKREDARRELMDHATLRV